MGEKNTTTVSVIWMNRKDFGFDLPEASRVGCASLLTSSGEQTTAYLWEGAGVDYLRKIFSIRREWGWYKDFPVYRLSPIEEAFWEYVREANLFVLGHVCVEQGVDGLFTKGIDMQKPSPLRGRDAFRYERIIANRLTDPQFAVQLIIKTSIYKHIRHTAFAEPVHDWLAGCEYERYEDDMGLLYQAVGDLTKESDISNIAKFLMNAVQLQIWWYGKLEIVGASFQNYPRLVSIYTGRPLQEWRCKSIVKGACDYFNY